MFFFFPCFLFGRLRRGGGLCVCKWVDAVRPGGGCSCCRWWWWWCLFAVCNRFFSQANAFPPCAFPVPVPAPSPLSPDVIFLFLFLFYFIFIFIDRRNPSLCVCNVTHASTHASTHRHSISFSPSPPSPSMAGCLFSVFFSSFCGPRREGRRGERVGGGGEERLVGAKPMPTL
jgi:hypothetical protein